MRIFLSVFLFFYGFERKSTTKTELKWRSVGKQAQVPNIELTVYMVYKNEQ